MSASTCRRVESPTERRDRKVLPSPESRTSRGGVPSYAQSGCSPVRHGKLAPSFLIGLAGRDDVDDIHQQAISIPNIIGSFFSFFSSIAGIVYS